MATGSGIQKQGGVKVSDITPDVALPSTAGLYDALGDVGRQFDQVIEHALKERAVEKGKKEGAAIAKGEQPYKKRFAFSDVGVARANAVESAYMAGIKTDIDSREAELRRDHAYDPEAYKDAAGKVVSGFIKGAPGPFAVEVEQYARSKVSAGHDVVARMRTQKDQQEAVQTLTVRERTLEQRLADRAATPGGEASAEFAADLQEWDNVQKTKAENPLMAFTPEQAQLKREAMLDGVTGVVISRETVAEYAKAGKGMPGHVAALRYLSDELENGEFKNVPPQKRQRYYDAAKKNLDAIYAGDKAEQQLADQKEREEAADRRERAGEWRLRVQLGEASAKDIKAADLDDSQKASLLAAIEAGQRRDAADARRDAALARVGRNQAYSEYRDASLAGTASDADLADAVKAGILKPGQAVTLRATRDRTLKPVIDDVMAPVKDEGKKPGRSMKGANVIEAQAEEMAVEWARQHPSATLEERLKQGGEIAKRVYGTQKGPASPQQATTDKSARLRALEGQRGKMTTGAYNAARKSILNGN